MFKKISCLLTSLCFLVMLSSCATTGSLKDTVKKAPGRAMTQNFNYSIADVYEATRQACLNLGLAVESSEKNETESAIYARTTANLGKIFWFGTGYGEMVGIFLTKISESSTQAQIVTQKSYKLDVGYKDYRGLLLDQIKLLLETKK